MVSVSLPNTSTEMQRTGKDLPNDKPWAQSELPKIFILEALSFILILLFCQV